MQNQCGDDLTKGKDIAGVLKKKKPQPSEAKGDLGAEFPAAKEFLRFSHKNTRFSTLSCRKKTCRCLQ